MMALLCCSGLSAKHFQFVLYPHPVLLPLSFPLSFTVLHPSSISLFVWLAAIRSLFVLYYSKNIQSETAFDALSQDSSLLNT